MKRTRLEPTRRRAMILAAATTLSLTRGYNRITRREVAAEAGVAPSLINVYFPLMGTLRAAVMQDAIRHGVLAIVAQGMVMRDPATLAAPVDVKRGAAEWVLGGDE